MSDTQATMRCPFCLNVPDAHYRPGDKPNPEPGDVCLCDECGSFSVVEDAGAFGGTRRRRPTPEEYAQLAIEPEAIAARRAWLETKQAGAPIAQRRARYAELLAEATTDPA